MDKASIRKLYLEKRQQLSAAELQKAQKLLIQQLISYPWKGLGRVHLFRAIAGKNEVDLTPLMEYLWQQQPPIEVVVPKLTDQNSLQHIKVSSTTDWQLSSWGIPEPITGPRVNPSELDVVLVPLLAFDLNGQRVGYGKGFYDRFLAQCKPSTKRIGVSFWGPGPSIETEATDVALHEVYTPHEVFTFRG